MTQSITVSDVTTVHYSGNLALDSLLDTGVNWNYLTPQPSALYYSFDINSGTQGGVPALTAFNNTQMNSTRGILNYVTTVTGIQFLETANGSAADFHFAANNIVNTSFAGLTNTSYSYSWNGSNIITAYNAEAYIYLDNANFAATTASPTSGTAGYELLLHEIGHALGLKHPFEGLYQLPSAQDNTNNTLMSYTKVGAPKTTFQSYDLLALKWIYGEDGLGGSNGTNNAAPTASNLNTTETYTEDTVKNLTDIVITDSDSSTVTAILTLSNTAAGSLNTATSGAVTSTYNAATGVWSANGAIANVNTLLTALTFTPATNFNGNFTIATSVSDGIAPAVTSSKSFTGIAVNDPALITGNSTGNVTEDAAPNTATGTLTSSDVDNTANLFLAKAAGSASSGGYGTYAMTTAGAWTYTLNNSNATVNALNTGGILTDTFTVNSADGTAKVITITINGANDNLILTGDAGDNTLTGDNGHDQLDGGLGNDTMIGGLGNDTYFVDSKSDVVTETSPLLTEIDTVYTSVGYALGNFVENLTLTGAAITGTGNALNNVLTGNASANTLDGRAGADTLIGGLGNDIYFVDNTGDVVTETSSLTTEIDKVNSAISYTLGNFLEKLTLTGADAIDGFGNGLRNTIFGNTANNTLNGYDGADTLNGGLGADTLIGGLGNDIYFVDNTGDVVTETSSLTTEIDKVNSSIDYTLGNYVENLTLTGTLAINGSGNARNNTLIGNSAANTLLGKAGADKLNGGEGADFLNGGFGKDSYNLTETTSASDTLRIAAGDSKVSGFDVATGFNLGMDKLDLDSTFITASTAAANGTDSDFIRSHHIADGLISFDDDNNFIAPLTLTSTDLAKAFIYLQTNITSPGNTVAFNAIGNTYIFQDSGANDTVVQLTGITANAISTTGSPVDSVWLV
ncbi:MAG: VCBS domain-containing protein [Methylococcaceae bacterium]